MIEAVRPWLADALVVLGLLLVTVGVYGLFRMPTVYAQLHAASKAAFPGAVALLLASSLTGETAIVLRAVLVASFLALTTPVAAHVVARAAYLEGEPMAEGAVDETGRAAEGG